MRLMPASSAAWIVAMLSARSAGPYMPDIPMAPRPISETTGPVAPSVRVVIMPSMMAARREAQGAAGLPRELCRHGAPAVAPEHGRAGLRERPGVERAPRVGDTGAASVDEHHASGRAARAASREHDRESPARADREAGERRAVREARADERAAVRQPEDADRDRAPAPAAALEPVDDAAGGEPERDGTRRAGRRAEAPRTAAGRTGEHTGARAHDASRGVG